MSEEKKSIKDRINELLEPIGLMKALNIADINHKPHQYVIGPKHIAHATDHYGGILGDATLEAVPCAYPRCGLSYKEHTHDRAIFLQLQRDGTNEEATEELKKIVDLMKEDKIDGFLMVETEEKYRIT